MGKHRRLAQLEDTALAMAQALEPLVLPRRLEKMRAVLATRSDHVVFAFEAMVDPHNLSAALRSLDAFSFQDVYLVRYQGKTGLSKGVTRGADKWLSVHAMESTAELAVRLKERGYRLAASHLRHDAVDLEQMDFSQPTALLFGNEHAGVGPEALALADLVFRIPMRGFVESFNLSVSAALAAQTARREIDRLGAEDQAPWRLDPLRRNMLYAAWLRRHVRRGEEILAKKGIDHRLIPLDP
ncbi:MAG: RNA methyltransferase [Deltaproteobacteria bacterium]|nr:RNA methyltransferase [Deltaproteobacteria bacterium]